MKNTMKAMLMMLLACSLSAVAQTGMSSDSNNKDQMSGKKMSMTGCIAEKDGKYMMMNQEHPDGVMLMSSEDLKPHVGHKVKVMGMMQSMSDDSMKGDSMKADDKMAGGDSMKHDNMGMMGMKVSGMKMMSDHCEMSKMK